MITGRYFLRASAIIFALLLGACSGGGGEESSGSSNSSNGSSTPVATGPTISSFTATPSSLTAPGSVTLNWSVANATSLSISPSIGVVTGTSVTTNVTTTTTFTLTASDGTTPKTATITVVVSPTGLVDHPRLWLTPTTLSTLRSRAASGDAAWVTLRAACDSLALKSVQFPDGTGPSSNAITGGYQYFDYLDPMISLGLCYQVAKTADAARAVNYAAKGRELVLALSDPVHHGRESTDSGWSIRAYGPALAFGYDWLYDQLSNADRVQIYTEINRWVSWFDTSGFGRNHPQGNYFAGYYVAKALGALATEGDNPNASTMWTQWLDMHFNKVQPFYSSWLSGGGWPEGMGYGINGTLNMLRPILAARTAKGLDLLHDSAKPFAFPEGHARWAEHFTWPDLLSFDDRGHVYENDNPTATSAQWTTEYLGLLRAAGGNTASGMQRYARETRGTKKANPWTEFLFWDESDSGTDYKTARSYRTVGDGQVAMRSAWTTDAVWGGFQSGPYTNYDQSGEELYDQGGLTIKRGGIQFLVNTRGALMRNSPGTTDSSAQNYGDFIYNDHYGVDNGADHPRRIFNVFIAKRSPAYWGQFSYGPGATTTSLNHFEDGGPYVVMRGINLEKMYMSGTPITGWTREVLYVRPNYFLVYDRTSVNSASAEQWQGFHVLRTPASQAAATDTTRYDVVDATGVYASNPLFRGRISTLLPKGHTVSVVNVFNSNKVYRLEIRPPASANNRWLTVFDAASSSAQAATAEPLTSANGGVTAGDIEGGYLTYANGSGLAALFSTTGAVPSLPLTFKIPSASTNRIILPNLASNVSYNVNATTASGRTTIEITSGSTFRASAEGVLAVQVGSGNTVSALTE